MYFFFALHISRKAELERSAMATSLSPPLLSLSYSLVKGIAASFLVK